ncbi:cation transporter [Ignisphaera aggregans DSM 17230]|uniref:Cation transporter n=1 Tax=Ignisphaera aggregans (strain DSM 17230 / JCM 13409 / AQ1.S1) TaxID=583356 RepID=E0SRK9_IGNAA|nr:cation transporter [Ignisphaera aggregans DSM 17230]
MSKRLKAIIFSVSILVTTILFIALLLGVIFFLYSSYTGIEIEKLSSIRLIEISLVMILIFLIPTYLCRGEPITEIIDAFIVVVLSWLIIPCVSAIIYRYTIDLDIFDAFFESISGFTGTGLTIITTPEDLPYVILLWRSITQWTGELGIVVVSGALLPFLHRFLRTVYMAERGSRLAPTIISTIRRLFIVYIIYTSIGVILLSISGMNILDSIAHSMTAIATGGMSTNSQSIGYWFQGKNYLILATSGIVMVLGAFNFNDLYNLIRFKLRNFFSSPEVRGFIAISLIFTLVIGIVGYIMNISNKTIIWIYHMLSGFTTTGFQIDNIYNDPDIIKLILILAMVIGGATFSTAGGIKIKRFIIALKSISWELLRPFIPEETIVVKRLGREVLDESEVSMVLSFIFLYFITAIILSSTLYITLIINNIYMYSYIDCLFETISAQSAVGLSIGITNISAPIASKMVLIIAMYLGRLEFLPIYLLIGSYYRKRYVFE